MKIALIQCSLWSTLIRPYSLAFLFANLKREGRSLFCYDFNVKLLRCPELKREVPTFSKKDELMDRHDRNYVLRFIEEHEYY